MAGVSRRTWTIIGVVVAIVAIIAAFGLRLTDRVPDAAAYEERLIAAVNDIRADAGSPPLIEDACLTAVAAGQTESYLAALNLRATLEGVDCEGLELFHERPIRSISSPEEIAELWARAGVRYDLLVEPTATRYGLSCFTYDPHPQPGYTAPMTCTLVMAAEVEGA